MLNRYLFTALSFTFLSISTFSKDEINLNSFINDSKVIANYGLLHLVPKYEKNLDPNKAISLDYFYGNFSSLEGENSGLAQALKELSPEEKDILKIKTHHSRKLNKEEIHFVEKVTKELGLNTKSIINEQIPTFNNIKRLPSSLKFNPGRKTWTLVRGVSSASGPYAALYYGLGEDAFTSFNIAVWAGIFSGAATYFSGPLDKWTTSEGMAHWLLESPSKKASAFRKIFGLNSVAFHEALIRNKSLIQAKYPNTYKEYQAYFDKVALNETKNNLAALPKGQNQITFLKRVKLPEEYLKWYITEFSFNTIALEIPRYVAGLSSYAHIGEAFSTLAGVSAWGLIAQAPADLAITKIKFKEVAELREDIINNKLNVDDSNILLREIDKVLAKDGAHANYTINDKSHRLLQRIENMARMKATILSFLSVTGVALKLMSDDNDFAGTVADPYLKILATSGALYFAYANDWLTPNTLRKLKNKLSMSKLGLKHHAFPIRKCFESYRP